MSERSSRTTIPRLFPVPWRSRSVQPHPAGYAIHADQILDTEMQSHAEHEQGNPDLRQLLSLMGICDQPGRERPHGDAREQVSDDGGQSYQPGEVASDERRAQCDGDGGDEIGAVDLDRILQISVREGRYRVRKRLGIGHPCYVGRDDDNSASASPTWGERALATANVVLAGGLVLGKLKAEA